MEKKLKLKGHKLVTYWRGCEDSFANGRCECGHWHFTGWSELMRSVRISHQGHVKRVSEGRAVPGFDIPRE